MNSATPALLALLLVCSLPAMAIVAADSGLDGSGEPDGSVQDDVPRTPLEIENTTNRLQLGETTHGYAGATPNLGSVFASTDEELRVDHEQYVFVERGFDTASSTEREEMIEAAHSRITDRTAELEEREETVVRQHANGEKSDDELVRSLLEIYHEASVLLDGLDRLEERADDVVGYSLSSNQVRENTRALEAHRTTIKSELAASSADLEADDRFEVLIQTSEEGYRLSIIEGETYISETTRFDNYDPEAPDQFAGTDRDAYDYAGELYPWAAEHGSPNYLAAGSIHDISFTANEFDIRMYIDGGTGEVYRELQRLSIDSLPIKEHETWSQDGLELSTRTTPANGPVEVTVTDAETGEPESSTIAVDGHELGETESDGTLWIIPPIGEYELAAETQTGGINVTTETPGG
ncbi:hypothetical protein EA462_11775 [Natrarchaeobius halalkaliphilus]|uniref:Uncharacterized protein n=1 Tax=Natrarchaeobius halalkaliphilus TaxID=1679091 RepID=A0A3N6M1U4_9EURY|nr:hypothetical protein [Natrarchaeobius halalkaliphilus]RQG89051.1 hypothetical protein EA462_11775 [Natrarchaeobius halalkaliphilus]